MSFLFETMNKLEPALIQSVPPSYVCERLSFMKICSSEILETFFMIITIITKIISLHYYLYRCNVLVIFWQMCCWFVKLTPFSFVTKQLLFSSLGQIASLVLSFKNYVIFLCKTYYLLKTVGFPISRDFFEKRSGSFCHRIFHLPHFCNLISTIISIWPVW